MKLESFKNNRWMFVGMVKDHAVKSNPKDNFSCGWSGSYGWILGSNGGHVWKNTISTMDDTLTGVCKQGDTVELILVCEACKLSLHLPTCLKFHIEIPKFESWRLNVTLFHPNNKVRIIES